MYGNTILTKTPLLKTNGLNKVYKDAMGKTSAGLLRKNVWLLHRIPTTTDSRLLRKFIVWRFGNDNYQLVSSLINFSLQTSTPAMIFETCISIHAHSTLM